jgi:GTPase SAR1 family protein
MNFFHLNKINKNKKLVVLVGDAGVGKTHLLNRYSKYKN